MYLLYIYHPPAGEASSATPAITSVILSYSLTFLIGVIIVVAKIIIRYRIYNEVSIGLTKNEEVDMQHAARAAKHHVPQYTSSKKSHARILFCLLKAKKDGGNSYISPSELARMLEAEFGKECLVATAKTGLIMMAHEGFAEKALGGGLWAITEAGENEFKKIQKENSPHYFARTSSPEAMMLL
jgi:hypothetical protein